MNNLRSAIVISLLASLAVVSGCGEQRVLERLGYVQIVGYDKGQGEQLKVSFYLPKFGPEFGTTKGEFLTATARSGKEAKTKIVRQTNWDIVSGQLRNLLLSDSLAREGVWPHLDTMVRDPTISPRVKISIVEGEAAGILGKSYAQHPSTGIYIDRLLETGIAAQDIPRISLFEFQRDFLDDGIDPIMPVLKDLGNDVEVTGLALFRADRYAGKLKAEDIPIFLMLFENNSKLDIYQDLGSGDRQGSSFTMLSGVKTTRKVKARRLSSGQFELQIRVRAQGHVTEYRGEQDMASEEQRKQLEQTVSEQLSERAERLIALLQRTKSDSLGFGSYVRNSMPYRAWKQLDWPEEFPEAKIRCQVRFTIQSFGKFS